MLSKIDKVQAPMSGTALIADVRSAALALVRREEYRVGSRMIAYENVAAAVGMSGSWLRQFIGNSDKVSLSFAVGMNIVFLYERLCSRIEKQIREIKDETDALNLEMDGRFACALGGEAEAQAAPQTLAISDR